MPEFFLELFSEEIPARMQAAAARDLERVTAALFAELQATATRSFFGPRRIAISATVAAEKAAAWTEERGPRDAAPEAALAGFLKKHGAAREELATEGGYYWLRKTLPAVAAAELLLKKLPAELTKFAWPKSMRWGSGGEFTWVRPLRRIVCLLDGAVVPITLGPVTASDETEGHRVMAPGAFRVTSAADWQAKLNAHYVIADAADRQRNIGESLAVGAKKLELDVARDDVAISDPLLDEVTGLVEWPVALLGEIDAKFMDLPREVRELSMKVNQKYFALRDAAGAPAPFFAFVANLQAPDGGAAIVAGNERVLRARLADARHFWDLDLKTPLDVLLPKLEAITFHAKIGTQRARANRIAALARQIAEQLGADGHEAEQAHWAGLLSKADLVTGMVGEFPELQGVMGGYYAEKNARSWDGAAVGPAIRTHYQPKGPGDAVPVGVVPASVALADKLDTLREFFRIGETPTGSGDPYALRRAALGVIRIVLENGLRLPLTPLLGGDAALFGFIVERLRVKLRGEGRRFDVLDAVLAAGTDDDLVRIMQRVDAVSTFLKSEDGANLLTAYRRAANILRIEDARDGPHRAETLTQLAPVPEEQDFLDALSKVQNSTVKDFKNGEYETAMRSLAELRAPVDAFFDKVTVNAPEPDVRRNRLSMLAELRDTMHQVADFSKIEG